MKKRVILLSLVVMGAALALPACNRDETVEPTVCWVDLGLPSGLLWAECNLGATKPEEYGDHYAWGETATKIVYNLNTYKYCTDYYNLLTKYCTDPEYGYNGFTDNLTTLQPIDDVATQKLGAGARMPTAGEWRELVANTTSEWTTMNGVNGRKFTAANGKSLFLPAAGERIGSGIYSVGGKGVYWSSILNADYTRYAYAFGFNSNDECMSCYYYYKRCNGLSIRAVSASQK